MTTETEQGACQFTYTDTSAIKPSNNRSTEDECVLNFDNPTYSGAQVSSSNQSEACDSLNNLYQAHNSYLFIP